MSDIVLAMNPTSIAEAVKQAKEAIIQGTVDPIIAHINIQKMAKIIDEYSKDKQVRRITLDAFELYGKKSVTRGDATLEITETGTRYDYSTTGDARIAELYELKKALDADIKEREQYLKSLPSSGVQVIDSDTGEVATLYPPVKTSTTWIRTTFAK
jgi:hypothetical protein